MLLFVIFLILQNIIMLLYSGIPVLCESDTSQVINLLVIQEPGLQTNIYV